MNRCLIVGGGVIGLSIAYDLARHGVHVELMDRQRPGVEASWAGAGILPPANVETAVHPYDKLRALSHQLHPLWSAELQKECGIDNEFLRCGGLHLARSAGESAALRALWQQLQHEQITAHLLSPEETVKLENALQPLHQSGRLRAACYLPDEAQLRNPRHLQALKQSCLHRGVKFTNGAELKRLVIHGNRTTEAKTSVGTTPVDQVCICSGAWTHAVLNELGFTNGLMPIRGQMVLYRCPHPVLHHVLNEGPRYLVPRRDGHVLVGSTEEEVGFDKRTTSGAIEELMNLASSLIPELSPDRVQQTWAGLRPGSFDGFPYLGAVPGLENVFVAAGHFRSGIHLSTGTAVTMSQLIRGEVPQIDLSPFRVGRG